jgi:hypothetical protein
MLPQDARATLAVAPVLARERAERRARAPH